VQDCVQTTTETIEQTAPTATSTTTSSIVPGLVTSGIVQRPTTTKPTITQSVEEEKVPFTETTTYLVLLGSGIAVTILMMIGLMVLLFI